MGKGTNVSFLEGTVRSDDETEGNLGLVENAVGGRNGVDGRSHVGRVGYGGWTGSDGSLRSSNEQRRARRDR